MMLPNGKRGPVEMSTPSVPGRSVLIVDDSPALRCLLLDYMALLGIEAREASNGLEALSTIEHHRPDVVLLDLAMPVMGGLETIPHIRKIDPSIRIILMTGGDNYAMRSQVDSLALELLLKPFELRAIAALFGPFPPAGPYVPPNGGRPMPA